MVKDDEFLIHSYLTNGEVLVDFAVLFLQSFKKFNGEGYNILFESRDLSDKQIDRLKSVYSKLKIINKEINYEQLSEKLDISIPDILKLKEACEIKQRNIGVTGAIPWKQFISVEERYKKSLKEGLLYCKENNIKYMMHNDIDTCFYNNIKPITNVIVNHDITMQFRNSKIERKAVGNFLGFKVNDNTIKFLDKWIEYIDKIPLKDKPAGYGQLSLYYAYRDMVDVIDIGRISSDFSASRKNFRKIKNGKRIKNPKKVILFNGGKGNKKTNINQFRQFLKDKKNG
jgi:hypothetical protein